MSNLRLTIGALAIAIAGCATDQASQLPPLSVPFPKRSTIASLAGDYKSFVAMWTGSLPARPTEEPLPLTPSDSRSIPVAGSEKSMRRQFAVLVTTFEEWCTDSKGVARLRGDDMVSPGKRLSVCETQSGEKIAALRVDEDADARKAGRHALHVQHWYPPDVQRYIQEWRAKGEQDAAERRQALAQRAARDEAARLASKTRDKAAIAQFAAMAGTRTTPTCQRFERESNALRARYAFSVERTDVRRYISDLAVAYDECIRSRTPPPQGLATLYQLNMLNLQLLADVWDAQLLSCEANGRCQISKPTSSSQQQQMAQLQARYPDLRMFSSPERADEILDRVQSFVVDR